MLLSVASSAVFSCDFDLGTIVAHFIRDMFPAAFFFGFEYLIRSALGEMVAGFTDCGEVTEAGRLGSCLLSFSRL